MMLFKLIWRRFLKGYQNSRLHYLVSKCLHALQFEGFIITYSQFGEDMILENYFRGRKNGFYVDIGANRPIQGSNTFKLYLNGWKGINVDGNKKLIDQFKKVRKRDVSLCEIVSNNKEQVKFFVSDDDRVSTVSREFKEWIKEHRSYDHEVVMLPMSLEEILDEHLPVSQKIDFLSIDVEGHDYEVLISNNFEKYKPEVICIEDHSFSFSDITSSAICRYLMQKQYELQGYAYPNLFFKRNGN
ncbi:FkbM family methyltransferase [Lacibacter cauensis]|uniref:FkbM family methyltransferase n=1 Tax=Lacibacter cauensis TaxID=510947 RepID=A0A562SHS6_9BACT|nr:FkbM family methyltransferase [Lacibacter cauensis]TWI80346.1 FkbM family methyltransferase [Lacibacter cauensis]